MVLYNAFTTYVLDYLDLDFDFYFCRAIRSSTLSVELISIFSLGYSFPSPFGNLWFIYMILLLSTFGILIHNISHKYQIFSAIALSLLIHYFLMLFQFDLMINKLLLANLTYKGLPFFLLGFIFKEHIIIFLKRKIYYWHL